MRRFLVLLMLLVPLQLSWAAVSAYCEHEPEAASHHVGHHEHKHQQDQSDHGNDSGPDSKLNNFDADCDADCGVCHVSCSMALGGGIAPSDFTGSDFTSAHPQSLQLTKFSSKPERPKWIGLA